MVHQHFTLADNLTVLDNILIGTEPLWQPFSRRRAARARLREAAQRFGLPVDPDARVGELSVGERQRVEILKALYRGARVLILDEPTAVLTPQESRDRCSRRCGSSSRRPVDHLHQPQARRSAARVGSDRGAAQRPARRRARAPATTKREQLAELMVGRAVVMPTRERRPTARVGEPLCVLDACRRAMARARPPR